MHTLFRELRILFHRDFGNLSNMILSSREYRTKLQPGCSREATKARFSLLRARPPLLAKPSLDKYNILYDNHFHDVGPRCSYSPMPRHVFSPMGKALKARGWSPSAAIVSFKR
jgi:hypothetical protein